MTATPTPIENPPPDLVAEMSRDLTAGGDRAARWLALPPADPELGVATIDVDTPNGPTVVELPLGNLDDGPRPADTFGGMHRALALDGDSPRVVRVISGGARDANTAGVWCELAPGGAPGYVTFWALLADERPAQR
jgi:hypothetical protein